MTPQLPTSAYRSKAQPSTHNAVGVIPLMVANPVCPVDVQHLQ